MILQALMAYAERDNLGDPDFQAVDVRWQISLTASGSLAAPPIPWWENPEAENPRPKKLIRPFTSPNELNQGTKSHFLCDTLERSALFLDPTAAEKAASRKVQHGYFKQLLAEAAAACPTEAPRLNTWLHFLNDPNSLQSLHDELVKTKAKPADNVVFTIDGWNPLESGPLKQFWRRRRGQASAGVVRTRRVCIATGEMSETLDTTEKIKGVPGGLATGTNLISFDKDSFCSLGLEQAQNAALSAAAELKIRSALNQLIENSRAQGLVFNDTVHLHWSRQPMEMDPLDPLITGDPLAVEKLLKSVRDGRQLLGLDANAYYCLSLSGNGGRIVVRDWLASSVPEIERHVAEWFEDLALIEVDGSGVKRDFKFGALLYGLVRAELAELAPQIPTELLHGALRGRSVPLPQSALAAALRRQQLDQDNKLNPARLAIIKACLIRSPNAQNQKPPTKETTMTESLNLESPDAAYLCGRLFAVFDRLQYLALGGVNAGVVERYYASASTTPALVMGRLFRNAQFHLAKTEGGVGTNVQKDFETITSALGSQFPAALDLEGQGRFALGYYHQKADYRRRTAERKESAAVAGNAI